MLQALDNLSLKEQMVRQILEQREFLENQLKKLPCVERVYQSEANFLLVKFRSSVEVYQYLISHKIIVRDRSNMIRCKDCLRISVGRPDENQRLIEVLRKYDNDC